MTLKLILKHLIFAIAMSGAINYGLIGLFNFDIISYIFGAESFLCRIIYITIGFCAVFSATFAVIDCQCHCEFFNNKK